MSYFETDLSFSAFRMLVRLGSAITLEWKRSAAPPALYSGRVALFVHTVIERHGAPFLPTISVRVWWFVRPAAVSVNLPPLLLQVSDRKYAVI